MPLIWQMLIIVTHVKIEISLVSHLTVLNEKTEVSLSLISQVLIIITHVKIEIPFVSHLTNALSCNGWRPVNVAIMVDIGVKIRFLLEVEHLSSGV